MIEQVSPATANPTLGHAVLPRTTKRSFDRFTAYCPDSSLYFASEFRISVEDQILARRRVGKSFPQLLHNPSSGRMSGDVEVQDSSAVVTDDEEAVENA